MARFLHDEKLHQTVFKQESPFFSDPARQDGDYKGKLRPFCVPTGHAEENLIPDARQAALEYFAAKNIRWHDGQDGKPSNHLCDSQVCDVNFLFAFANRPEALAALLRPFFPELRRAVPIEDDQFVTFEQYGQGWSTGRAGSSASAPRNCSAPCWRSRQPTCRVGLGI